MNSSRCICAEEEIALLQSELESMGKAVYL